MLAKENRLRHTADFQAVRRRGNRWRRGPLTLNASRNGLETSRFGFVVTKKVGKAVARNKVKRRLRAVIRSHLPHIAPGFDVVIIVYPLAADMSFADLNQQVVMLLKDAGLLT